MQQQIQLRNKLVAIEKSKKANAKVAGALIMPETEEYVGVIKYIGTEVTGLQVGQRVYFSKQYQNFRMGGADVCVMQESEVLAIVTDEK